jgi:transcriptional regulator with XRE-family HTH domain
MAKEEIIIHSTADLGPTLRKLREARGLSQEQLAEKIGVTQRQVSRWEIGPNLVNHQNFLRVLAALDGGLIVRY